MSWSHTIQIQVFVQVVRLSFLDLLDLNHQLVNIRFDVELEVSKFSWQSPESKPKKKSWVSSTSRKDSEGRQVRLTWLEIERPASFEWVEPDLIISWASWDKRPIIKLGSMAWWSGWLTESNSIDSSLSFVSVLIGSMVIFYRSWRWWLRIDVRRSYTRGVRKVQFGVWWQRPRNARRWTWSLTPGEARRGSSGPEFPRALALCPWHPKGLIKNLPKTKTRPKPILGVKCVLLRVQVISAAPKAWSSREFLDRLEYPTPFRKSLDQEHKD